MEIGFSKKKSTKAQKTYEMMRSLNFPHFLEGKMIKKTGKFIFSKSLWRTVNIVNSFKFFVL